MGLDRALPQAVGIEQVGGQGERGGPIGPVVQGRGRGRQRTGNPRPALACADVLEAPSLDQTSGQGRDPQGEGVVAGPLAPELDQVGHQVLVVVARGIAGAEVDGQRPAAQRGQQLVRRRGEQQEVPGRSVGRLLEGLEQHVRSGRMQRFRFDDDEHLAPGLERRHLGRLQQGSDLVDGDDRFPLLRVAAHEDEVGMEDLVGLEVDPPAVLARAAGTHVRLPFAQQRPGDPAGKGQALLRLASVEDDRRIQPALGREPCQLLSGPVHAPVDRSGCSCASRSESASSTVSATVSIGAEASMRRKRSGSPAIRSRNAAWTRR